MVLPCRVDRQRCPAPALEVFSPCATDASHLPVIVMDDVSIGRWEAWGGSFLSVVGDRYMVEASLLIARRWLKARR